MYSDRSITSDQTVHNNRPDVVTFDKTIKEAYLVAISAVTAFIQPHRQEAPEIYGPKRIGSKNMATECSLYSTISIIHKYYTVSVMQQFETAPSSSWSIYSNAESSNTRYMLYSSNIFSRLMN